MDIYLPRALDSQAIVTETKCNSPLKPDLSAQFCKGSMEKLNSNGERWIDGPQQTNVDDVSDTAIPISDSTVNGCSSIGEASANALAPVVVLISGGAWLIGYKGWGGFVARKLAQLGLVVVSVDYRNFPETQIGGMIEDVEAAVDWVCSNVHNYGGDPGKVTLCGHSAGAHLGACVMVRRAGRQASCNGHNLLAFVGLSGAYHLRGIMEHCHQMGLYRHVFLKLFQGTLLACYWVFVQRS